MNYDNFVKDYFKKGLIKNHRLNFREIEKLVNRAAKEIEAAKANLDIDEGIAYTIAYTSMLHVRKSTNVFEEIPPC